MITLYLAVCAAVIVIAAGCLLLAGKYAQRGILWTARMGDDE